MNCEARGKDAVRVRFAPSPSGTLHLGNVRTALINWLFARSRGGSFILRIEDTDAAKSSPESVQSIIRDLKWLGMDADEGPEQGGAYAPYFQSQRLELFKGALAELADKGFAYPCFCSQERLSILKETQRRSGKPPKYDNLCRGVKPEEARARVTAGEPHVWRFRLPDDKMVEVCDMLRGTLEFNSESLGGDPVIVRADGSFLFIFAGAYDDAAMRITHIIRGDDHLSNTARQVEIMKALGAQPPKFAHLPLIVDPEGKPLSKRLGSADVASLKEAGFLPEAVVNHLTIMGAGLAEGEDDFKTVAQCVESFEINRYGKAAAVHDVKRLERLNARHLREKTGDEAFALVEPFILSGSPVLEPWADEAALRGAACALKSESSTLKELAEKIVDFTSEFAPDAQAAAVLNKEENKTLPQIALETLAAFEPFETDSLTPAQAEEFLNKFCELTGRKGMQAYKPLRAMLTGRLRGLPLHDVLTLLPAETIKKRLKRAM